MFCYLRDGQLHCIIEKKDFLHVGRLFCKIPADFLCQKRRVNLILNRYALFFKIGKIDLFAVFCLEEKRADCFKPAAQGVIARKFLPCKAHDKGLAIFYIVCTASFQDGVKLGIGILKKIMRIRYAFAARRKKRENLSVGGIVDVVKKRSDIRADHNSPPFRI